MKNQVQAKAIKVELNGVNNYKLQSLTTKEIIQQILKQDRPLVQAKLQQPQQSYSKYKQCRLLKNTKLILEYDSSQKHSFNQNKHQSHQDQQQQNHNQSHQDYLRQSQDQLRQSQDSLTQNQESLRQNQSQQEIQKQDGIINQPSNKQIQHKIKNLNRNDHQLSSSSQDRNRGYSHFNQDSITINDTYTHNLSQTERKSSSNNWISLQTEYINKNNLTQDSILQSTERDKKSDKYIINQQKDQHHSFQLLKNKQFSIECQLNPQIPFNPLKMLPQNQFVRKNSRNYIIRRSLADVFSHQPKIFQNNNNNNNNNNNSQDITFKEKNNSKIQHSFSQGDVFSTIKESQIFDCFFEKSFVIQKEQNRMSASFHNNNNNNKNNSNSQRSSLQDLLAKNQKQNKSNLVQLKFNNSMNTTLSKKKSIQSNQQSPQKQKQQSYQLDDQQEQNESEQQQIGENTKRVKNEFHQKFQPKRSRINNEVNNLEFNIQSHRQEREQSAQKSRIPLINKSKSNERVVSKQELNEINQMNENKDQQYQEYDESIDEKQHRKIGQFSLQKKFQNSYVEQVEMKKQNEISRIQQSKTIQELLCQMNRSRKQFNDVQQFNEVKQHSVEKKREDDQFQQHNSNVNQLSYRQSACSNFQYQPIQSINVSKYNEFKLNKKRRALSFQNQFLQESGQQNENTITKNVSYFTNILEGYDAQSMTILKSRILMNENREDKSFDLNSFLYQHQNNLVTNPILNKSYKEDKIQHIRNIRSNYSSKPQSQSNSLTKRTTNPSPLIQPQNNKHQKVDKKSENTINFSAWDNEIDIYKRQDYEDLLLLDAYNKKTTLQT